MIDLPGVCPHCGHACCTDQEDTFHGFFLAPRECPQCKRVLFQRIEDARAERDGQ